MTTLKFKFVVSRPRTAGKTDRAASPAAKQKDASSVLKIVLGLVLVIWLGCDCASKQVEHVIHISIDGLRPDAIRNLGPTRTPNFHKIKIEGAWTDNARTDHDFTDTLPNHCSQLTGRPVLGPEGHNWTKNEDPPPDQTLASNKGTYIAGVFDVVHDYGFKTAAFVSKSKLQLFAVSWNETNGAPDTVGEDNGRAKIDYFLYHPNTDTLVQAMLNHIATQHPHYVFLHLLDPDVAGHTYGWDPTPDSPYASSVIKTDQLIGAILTFIESDPGMRGKTAIVLTADHGGTETGHGDPTNPANYTVPLYVWAPGIVRGEQLYKLNDGLRVDPGTNRLPYSVPLQPIRNGEAGNLCLYLLGLPPIPNSTFNVRQDLQLTPHFMLLIDDENLILVFRTAPAIIYDIENIQSLPDTHWTPCITNIAGTGECATNIIPKQNQYPSMFFRLRIRY